MALTRDKKEALADRIAFDVRQDWDNRVKDLETHEVPHDEAFKIVEYGILKAAKKWGR